MSPPPPNHANNNNNNNHRRSGTRSGAGGGGGYCCRLLPHGAYSLLVATLALLAWLSALMQDGCDMALVSGPVVQQLAPTFDENPIQVLEFGLEAYRRPATVLVDTGGDGGGGGETTTATTLDPLQGVCTEYPPELDQDTTWTASQILDFCALVLGGGGTLFVWCSTCFVFSRVTWRWTGYELALASLCQASSFIWYHNHLCEWNTCTLSWGGKLDIAAAVLWFVAAFLTTCRYPRPKRIDDDDDTNLADGRTSIEQGSGEATTEMTLAQRRSGGIVPQHDDDDDHYDCEVDDERVVVAEDDVTTTRFPEAHIT